MSQWKVSNFLRRNSNATTKRFLFLTIVLGLLIILFVYTKLPISVASISKSTTAQNDFDWLRNINYLPLFVRPEQVTAIVVPKDINAINERRFIACFVMSAPKNSRSRSAIRKTWGRLIKPLFLIAIGDNETMSAVSHEAQEFDDIIIEDFIDSYFNLTIKTAFAMKNFLRHFEDSKYFMKIDDDVYMNVENLRQLLEHAPSDALIGRVEYNKKPLREKDNKWFVPQFLFPDDEYPPYLDGPAYVVPGWCENVDKLSSEIEVYFRSHDS